MSLTVSEGSGSYQLPQAGTFAARCVKLIDLGTQVSTFDGEAKSAHKLLIAFEITDTDNRRDDGQPHLVQKRFTASLHTKAALRKFLESWRGKPFTAGELAGFDLKVLLGQPCLIGLVHESKGDKTQGEFFPNQLLFEINSELRRAGHSCAYPLQTRSCQPTQPPLHPFQNFMFAQ